MSNSTNQQRNYQPKGDGAKNYEPKSGPKFSETKGEREYVEKNIKGNSNQEGESQTRYYQKNERNGNDHYQSGRNNNGYQKRNGDNYSGGGNYNNNHYERNQDKDYNQTRYQVKNQGGNENEKNERNGDSHYQKKNENRETDRGQHKNYQERTYEKDYKQSRNGDRYQGRNEEGDGGRDSNYQGRNKNQNYRDRNAHSNYEGKKDDVQYVKKEQKQEERKVDSTPKEQGSNGQNTTERREQQYQKRYDNRDNRDNRGNNNYHGNTAKGEQVAYPEKKGGNQEQQYGKKDEYKKERHYDENYNNKKNYKKKSFHRDEHGDFKSQEDKKKNESSSHTAELLVNKKDTPSPLASKPSFVSGQNANGKKEENPKASTESKQTVNNASQPDQSKVMFGAGFNGLQLPSPQTPYLVIPQPNGTSIIIPQPQLLHMNLNIGQQDDQSKTQSPYFFIQPNGFPVADNQQPIQIAQQGLNYFPNMSPFFFNPMVVGQSQVQSPGDKKN